MTTVNSIAAEALFCAGWIAVGAAAAYSRYKKALELGYKAPGATVEGADRETHRGLYFGRSAIAVEDARAPEWKAPEIPEVAPTDAVAMAPVSLVLLAKALENAQRKAEPKEEKTPAP
jgi:hypothetical protein